jgi:hypothetical protein
MLAAMEDYVPESGFQQGDGVTTEASGASLLTVVPQPYPPRVTNCGLSVLTQPLLSRVLFVEMKARVSTFLLLAFANTLLTHRLSSIMVNESGNNGEGMSPLITEVNATNHVALEPSEEDLVAALQQYSRERLTAEQRIMRLQKELNYRIRQVQMLMEHILLVDRFFLQKY